MNDPITSESITAEYEAIKLKFSPMSDNAKLRETLREFARLKKLLFKEVTGYSFSLPSGFTCGKVAKECLTYANRDTGKLTRGKDAEYYCFSAASESYLPQVRAARWHNWELLQKLWNYAGSDYVDIANLILEALPVNADLIRVHVGGEFPGSDFGREYMRGWFHVAKVTGIHVYSYTKNVETYLEIRDEKPDNFNMTISVGGMRDDLIAKHNLKHARVIFHPDDANGMPIDHNDINAVFTYKTALNPSGSFNLLLHGTQPAGSDASAAIKRLKSESIKFSYSAKVGK
jgi:hypothetical protein